MDEAARHELPRCWTLRGHVPSIGDAYKVSYFHVFDVSTIADWVRLRRALRPGTILCDRRLQYRMHDRAICGLSLFVEGVRPEWEDDRNKGGFTCTARVSNAEDANAIWDGIVIDLVRGAGPDGVLGVQIVGRDLPAAQQVKLDVWCVRGTEPQQALCALDSYARRSRPIFKLVRRHESGRAGA